jgi:thermitase
MDHPDLAANVTPGWDLDRQVPITSAAGLYHSTRGAGLAAAVAGNNIGVAGVSQCAILPIAGTNYTTSFFYNAILWAADHGIRVVNASWDIANSATVNAGGEYLRDKIQGILVVSGANPKRPVTYAKYPFIFAVSMTDSADQTQSTYGPHIDLSAPGWNIFSTTTGSTYEYDTGTSYSAPIVAGVAACLLSINPALTTEQLTEILQSSAVDLGAPGWDPFYGWGRLDFARAAEMAFATLPLSRVSEVARGVVTVPLQTGAQVELWRAPDAQGPWTPLNSALVSTNDGVIRFEDSESLENAFYQARVTLP